MNHNRPVPFSSSPLWVRSFSARRWSLNSRTTSSSARTTRTCILEERTRRSRIRIFLAIRLLRKVLVNNMKKFMGNKLDWARELVVLVQRRLATASTTPRGDSSRQVRRATSKTQHPLLLINLRWVRWKNSNSSNRFREDFHPEENNNRLKVLLMKLLRCYSCRAHLLLEEAVTD